MRVEYSGSFDIGHGGSGRTCRITKTAAGYKVGATRDTPYPRPGQRDAAPAQEDLKKSPEEVRRFLDRLVSKLKLRELRSSKPGFMGLHPTFVTLRFQDSCGAKGELEYVFEGPESRDPGVRPVIEAFREFCKDPSS